MGRSCLAFVVLVLLSTAPAQSQYASAIQACGRDMAALCAANSSADGGFVACVKAQFPKISEPCKAALVKIAAVTDSCAADIREQCRSTKPGSGRILLCVKQHFSALSEPCKDAIGQAAQRKVDAH